MISDIFLVVVYSLPVTGPGMRMHNSLSNFYIVTKKYRRRPTHPRANLCDNYAGCLYMCFVVRTFFVLGILN